MRLLPGFLSRLLPAPVVSIEQLREGSHVTVRGHVVPRDLMDSPLTSTRCVYYRYAIEQWRKSRVAGVGGDGFWQSVERDEAILEFYLEDGHGRVIVSPENARVSQSRQIDDSPFELTVQRRAQQLLIESGDFIEVTGRVTVAEDLFDENRDYRASANRFMLCADGSRELRIRILEKRTPNRDS